MDLLGIENVAAGEGDDVIIGDPNSNELIGGLGENEVRGGGGDDVLSGDWREATATGFADAVIGGFGTDTCYQSGPDDIDCENVFRPQP